MLLLDDIWEKVNLKAVGVPHLNTSRSRATLKPLISSDIVVSCYGSFCLGLGFLTRSLLCFLLW